MKKNLLRKFVPALLTAAFLVTPAEARAEFLDFDVVEGTVPGANTQTLTDVDKLAGIYTEFISIDGLGNFTTSAYATFTAYASNEGTVAVGSQLGASDPNQYLIYALFDSTGTVTPLSGGVLQFTGVTATSTLYIDPNSDTTLSIVGGVATASGETSDDYEILLATSLLNPGSGGVLSVFPAIAGGFSLIFTDPALTSCAALSTECGEAYWPTLAAISILLANVTGDFDTVFAGIGIPSSGTITGDVSIVFADATIPEPATLTLLGLGLVGSAMVRRRRKSAV